MFNSVIKSGDLAMLQSLVTVEATPERIEAANAPRVKKNKAPLLAPTPKLECTFDYVDEDDMERVELIRGLREGGIPMPDELLVKLYRFDHYYEFSDSGSVHRANDVYKAELLEEIESRDFEPEIKEIYLSGIRGTGRLLEYSPALRALSCLKVDPKGVVGLALRGISDQQIDAAKRTLSIVVGAIIDADKGSTNSGCVYTHAAKGKERQIMDRISVNPNAQRGFLDFEAQMTKDRIDIMLNTQDELYVTHKGSEYVIDAYSQESHSNSDCERYSINVFKGQDKIGGVCLYLNPAL